MIYAVGLATLFVVDGVLESCYSTTYKNEL